MSESLATIDLSQIAVGGTGKIDLSGLKTAYNDPTNQALAHIRIYNDSGSTLEIRSDTGVTQDFIPAGAWPTYSIDHSVQAINFTVLGILPNPPIQLLMATYFAPGEEVPPTPQLGNSPVGIGGSAPLNVSATRLQDDADPTGTVLIESSVGGVQHINVTVDGLWQIISNLLRITQNAGVSTQIFLELINSAGHTWRVNMEPNNNLDFRDLTAGVVILQLLAAGGIVVNSGFVSVSQTTGTGVTALAIKSTDGQGEIDLQQLSTGTFRIQDDAPSTLMELFRGAGGMRLSGIGNKTKAWSQFTGTVTGTYNHNLGTTPNAVQVCQSVVGSQTMGTDTWGATTVHVTSGAGNAFVGEAKLYA